MPGWLPSRIAVYSLHPRQRHGLRGPGVRDHDQQLRQVVICPPGCATGIRCTAAGQCECVECPGSVPNGTCTCLGTRETVSFPTCVP